MKRRHDLNVREMMNDSPSPTSAAPLTKTKTARETAAKSAFFRFERCQGRDDEDPPGRRKKAEKGPE